MYGWRARIGVLYPTTGLVDEEFHRLAPPGVAVFMHRVSVRGNISVDQIKGFSDVDNLTKYAKDLESLRPNCIAWACTSGSFLMGKEGSQRQVAALARSTGTPVTNTSTGMVRALEHLGVKRVGVGTPYPSDLNTPIVRFLEEHGFEVVTIHNLGLQNDWEIGTTSPEVIYNLARRVSGEGAEAVFLACTGLPALDLIDTLEKDLGRPVLTANQVTMWHALQLCGISTEELDGYGVLFSRTEAKELAGVQH